MKIYRGRRLRPEQGTCSNVEVIVEDDKGKSRLRHHVYHSPTGFNWGYAGSGPADLARSILWDLLDKEPEMQLYMAFKNRFLTLWGNEWEISSDDIEGWFLEYGWHNGRPDSLLNRGQ